MVAIPHSIAIGRKLEQKAVRRRYYAGDFLPTLDMFVAGMKAKVPAIVGYDLVDVACTRTVDDNGVPCHLYVALFQRDGTTLEAQRAREEDRLTDLAAEEQGLKLDWGTPHKARDDT